MSNSAQSPGVPMRIPFHRSLRGKLTLLLIVLGLTPLSVMGFVSSWQARASLHEKAGTSLADFAFNASDKLDRNLFERYGDVQAFAKSDAAQSMDPARITAWIDTMMQTYTPVYNLMVVVDTQGRIVAANRIDKNGQSIASGPLIGLDVSGQEWFKTAVSGSLPPDKSIVDDLHEDGLMARVYGTGLPSYAMSFTYPIRDSSGRVVGVWSNRFNWQLATKILEDAHEHASNGGAASLRFHLVNKDGVVLVSDVAADTLTRNLKSHPIVSNALGSNASGFGEGVGLGAEGQEKMIGYFHSTGYSVYPGMSWAVLATQDRDEALADAQALTRNLIAIGLIAALLIAAIAFFVARSISDPVLEVVARLRSLASGGADLKTRLPVTSHDEVGELAIAFNAFVDSMTSIVKGIFDTSTKLASGATEIAAASNQMSAGAESQTHQVIRTSSAMEEMSQTIKGVARNTQSTAAATEAAVGRARQGTSRVQVALDSLGETNRLLQELSGRSVEIDHVVKLIADIAAQTHILSLNAAIEAAGAGAAGARFDVVADEIRKLAGRTAESTARISTTVAEIRRDTQRAADRMGETAAQAAEVGQSLEDIVECITSVNDMVTVISSSTMQQAKSAEQVADALQLITQVSQQTAQAARETTMTIDDLSGLARDMNQTVRRFQF